MHLYSLMLAWQRNLFDQGEGAWAPLFGDQGFAGRTNG